MIFSRFIIPRYRPLVSLFIARKAAKNVIASVKAMMNNTVPSTFHVSLLANDNDFRRVWTLICMSCLKNLAKIMLFLKDSESFMLFFELFVV